MPAEFGRVRIAAAILGAFLVGSCGGDDNTAQPTPLPPPPAAPAPVTLVRVDVGAPESIELQRSAQLSATAVRSDGTLKLSGANILLTNGQGDTFEGSVDPNNNVVFNFGTFFYNYVFYGPVTATGLVERLSPTTELVVSGSVNAIAAPTSIVGHLRGVFLERERAGFWETALCNSITRSTCGASEACCPGMGPRSVSCSPIHVVTTDRTGASASRLA